MYLRHNKHKHGHQFEGHVIRINVVEPFHCPSVLLHLVGCQSCRGVVGHGWMLIMLFVSQDQDASKRLLTHKKVQLRYVVNRWDPSALDPTYGVSNKRKSSGESICFLPEWLHLRVLLCYGACSTSVPTLPVSMHNFEHPKFSLSMVVPGVQLVSLHLVLHANRKTSVRAFA